MDSSGIRREFRARREFLLIAHRLNQRVHGTIGGGVPLAACLPVSVQRTIRWDTGGQAASGTRWTLRSNAA